MPNASASLWNDVLAQVRLSNPDLVRGWFNDLEFVQVEQGVMRIDARNSAQVRYLDQHCRHAFTEAAQAATGRLVAVTFQAVEEDAVLDPASERLQFDDGASGMELSPDSTFENFVTGPCNRLAHAAALGVAEKPGRAYNPFFIYGPVGLGKTHLLQAVCHAIRPHSNLLYISCETFINHFIEAVEHGGLHRFRYRYRHVDGLVIDDIQFLAERERSQEEFFHTFNTLHQSQRQIVLSADCSPSEIPSLEERLVSRFNSGLVALLDRPCLETRIAIVQRKAKLRCIEIPDDVAQHIASRVTTNIRELEGALIRLDAMSQSQGCPITIQMAKETLGAPPGRRVMIPTILERVAERFNVKVSDLQGKKRAKTFTLPRHVSMYLARQMTAHSLEQIGAYFGGRDHTTVIHASRAVSEMVENDPEFRVLVEETASEVKNALP